MLQKGIDCGNLSNIQHRPFTIRQVVPELRANGLLRMGAAQKSAKKLANCRAICVYLDHLIDVFAPSDILEGSVLTKVCLEKMLGLS